MTPCSSLKVIECFRKIMSPPSSGSKTKQCKNRIEAGSNPSLPQAGFLLDLFFDPEDGGDMFLRNVS
jgi:hypothetical protein